MPTVPLLRKLRLVFLIQHGGFQREIVHLGTHEAAIAVFRRADNRFATHIETRVDDYRTAGLLAEGFDDLPIERIGFASDGLNPRRVVYVGDRGYLGPLDV